MKPKLSKSDLKDILQLVIYKFTNNKVRLKELSIKNKKNYSLSKEIYNLIKLRSNLE